MRYFAPLGRLRSCLDKESVCAALREAGLEFQEIARTAEVIVHGGQKTFAILLTIHEESAISDFIAWDQMQCYSLDYRLPVQKASIAFLLPDTAERFYEEQWTFVAPVFSRNFHHRNLDRLTIMPFIRSESLGEGAFGTVYEVELHPQHHELHYLSKEGVSLLQLPVRFFVAYAFLESKNSPKKDQKEASFNAINFRRRANTLYIEWLKPSKHPGTFRLLHSSG